MYVGKGKSIFFYFKCKSLFYLGTNCLVVADHDLLFKWSFSIFHSCAVAYIYTYPRIIFSHMLAFSSFT